MVSQHFGGRGSVAALIRGAAINPRRNGRLDGRLGRFFQGGWLRPYLLMHLQR
ncbi:hypothetical protein ANI02nite_02750 [Acetobacter nitrogenifigens DSM 23921 = NBRC 105050]|uniref:Uncharacterized protein n=1 Tax=Acetobacter nitrogenifigens DSM 23921 = NBRC 105050 TaxID=1120919 RepID=A0A511X619_9PROT|nr:hypothetical protein ANI02nite_02750 [Acetobacter nitrogenifigens DSM 23921 = NBRC 105050]